MYYAPEKDQLYYTSALTIGMGSSWIAFFSLKKDHNIFFHFEKTNFNQNFKV